MIRIDLGGRIALVTGAANGIGRAAAATLAQCGAVVACADIDLAGVEELAAAIGRDGGSAVALRVDVSDYASVEAMAGATVSALGPIDVLVNSAAILIPPKPFHTISAEEWDKVYAVDVRGIFFCCKAVAAQMIRQRHGKIVNLGSVGGKIPRLNMAAYCSAKAAVIHLTKVMALELAPYNINVIAHCPGTTETGMVQTITEGDPAQRARWLSGVPLGRFATPQDQANFVAFLASDLAGHITGQAMNVDGGQVMW
jgi:NAD(P)-dependent dehydrogenase (short-subunit alcohol dehydrogenase family)